MLIYLGRQSGKMTPLVSVAFSYWQYLELLLKACSQSLAATLPPCARSKGPGISATRAAFLSHELSTAGAREPSSRALS